MRTVYNYTRFIQHFEIFFQKYKFLLFLINHFHRIVLFETALYAAFTSSACK